MNDESERHPAGIRRKWLFGDKKVLTAADTARFERIGLPTNTRASKINPYILIEKLEADFDGGPDLLERIRGSVAMYVTIIRSDESNNEVNRRLKLLPCVQHFLSSQCQINKKTRLKFLAEGWATDKMIERLAKFLNVPTDDLLWKENRNMYHTHAAGYALRTYFLQLLAANEFEECAELGRNVIPVFWQKALRHPDLQFNPAGESEFYFAIRKLADESFIRIVTAESNAKMEAFIETSDIEDIDEAIQLRVAVITTALAAKAETLSKLHVGRDQVELDAYFDQWRQGLEDFAIVLERGKASYQASHNLHRLGVNKPSRHVVTTTLVPFGDAFKQWRAWLKIACGSSSMATPPTSYRDAMRYYNERQLELHKALFDAFKPAQLGGRIFERKIRAVVEEHASTILGLLEGIEQLKKKFG